MEHFHPSIKSKGHKENLRFKGAFGISVDFKSPRLSKKLNYPSDFQIHDFRWFVKCGVNKTKKPGGIPPNYQMPKKWNSNEFEK